MGWDREGVAIRRRERRGVFKGRGGGATALVMWNVWFLEQTI
jgi:hypothetical protein